MRVNFSWAATQNADGYRLYHNDSLIASVSGVSHSTELNLPDGPNRFGIEPFNQHGFGPKTEIVKTAPKAPGPVEGLDVRIVQNVVVGPPATPTPDAPAGLAITATTSSSHTLDWDDYSGPYFGHYNVYQSTVGSSGPWTKINTADVTSSTYVASGLSASTAYWYHVKVDNGTGGESAESNIASGATDAPPASGLPTYTPTHYVAPHSEIVGVSSDGDAQTATDYSNSAGNPSDPCTLQCAMVNATAGDVIRVGAGVYTKARPDLGSADRYTPAWTVQNHGTQADPIIVYAENRIGTSYSAGVHTQLTHDGSSPGPVCGQGIENAGDYVIWDGFHIQEAAMQADTGPVVFWFNTGSKMRSCYIQGIDARPYHTIPDNHPGIRVEGSHDIELSDNYITGIAGGANGGNVMGVQTYSVVNCEFHHNTIEGISGFHIKEDRTDGNPHGGGNDQHQFGVKVHHNYIDCAGADNGTSSTWGINMGTLQDSATFGGDDNSDPISWVYQNVIVGTFGGDGSALRAQVQEGQHHNAVYWVNNSIYDVGTTGFGFGGTNPTTATILPDIYAIRNNIFFGSQFMFYSYKPFTEADLFQFGPFQRNIWTYSNRVFRHDLGTPNLNGYTWANFTGNGAESESPASFENPTAGEVNFVDGPGGDLRLDSGSIALAAGTDFLNLLGGGTSAPINCGAYILADQSDEIGRRT